MYGYANIGGTSAYSFNLQYQCNVQDISKRISMYRGSGGLFLKQYPCTERGKFTMVYMYRRDYFYSSVSGQQLNISTALSVYSGKVFYCSSINVQKGGGVFLQ